MADINQEVDLSDFVSNPVNVFYFIVFINVLVKIKSLIKMDYCLISRYYYLFDNLLNLQ